MKCVDRFKVFCKKANRASEGWMEGCGHVSSCVAVEGKPVVQVKGGGNCVDMWEVWGWGFGLELSTWWDRKCG